MFQSRAKPVVALMLLAASVAGCSAAAADSSPATHPCAALEDSAERLACYDAAFVRPGDEDGPDSKVVEEFGLTETQLQARDPERPRDQGPERIEAKVASIRYQSTGERIITLDNGQVWRQTEVTVRGPLSPGDAVIIRRAAFGSFQIVTPGRVALRVRRIE